MLEIAPAYSEHLAGTHNKATSLAKIVGFYSGMYILRGQVGLMGLVKIHDVQANSRKTMDLLVMENLFYKQTIKETYDLKGIGWSYSLFLPGTGFPADLAQKVAKYLNSLLAVPFSTPSGSKQWPNHPFYSILVRRIS